MARLPRFVIPGQPQHIIQRGNNRQSIFITDRDYEYYLDKLLLASQEHECKIHAYVQMSNHVHLLVTPEKESSISKMMQMLGRYYVQYFNYHYRRTGTLWEGRYKATLISTEQYLFTCMRYIELNPVRAKMVMEPSEYRWSSYHYNVIGKADPLVTSHREYCKLGKTEDEQRDAYRELFKNEINKETLDEIREATNKSWGLGDSQFKKDIEQQLQRRASPKARGGDRKSRRYRENANINRV